MAWPLAMMALGPLMLVGSRAKIRVWLAMFGSSLVGGLLHADAVMIFALIDVTAAWIILQSPKGLAQRSIGLLSVGALCFHVGFIAATLFRPDADLLAYAHMQRVLGWAQFAVLAAWGGADAVKAAVHRFWPRRDPLAAGGRV